MTTISSSARQLRTTLATLRGSGMEPAVREDNVALAVASADLAADRCVAVRFKDLGVQSSVDGKKCRVEDEAGFQSFGLSRAQLTKMAGIVGGDTSGLSGDEQKALSAVQSLIQKGAAFQMTTFHTRSEKSMLTTITLPASSPAAQGLIVLRPEIKDDWNRSLSVVLDGAQFPIRSLDHLVQTAERDSLEKAAHGLSDMLDVLRKNGIEVAVGAGPADLSAASRRLDAGESIAARFKQAAVTSTRDGKPHPPPEQQVTALQTMHLRQDDLETAVAILNGRDADLSDDVRVDLEAMDSLTRSGASFQISRSRNERGMVSNLLLTRGHECRDTLAVPADNSGRALALLHLHSYRFGMRLAVVLDGKEYPLEYPGKLREVAANNCRGMLLQSTLETLRAHGVDVKVDDNAIARQVAVNQLDANETIPVTFKNAAVTSTQGDKISAEAQATLQTFSLRMEQLTHMATILGDNEGLLSASDRKGFEAIDKLRSNGAHFEIRRTREQARELRSALEFTDTLRVPEGKLGNAVIVAAFAPDRNRQLSLVAEGVSYPVRSLDELAAIAQHLGDPA